jgi:hypothetical protein
MNLSPEYFLSIGAEETTPTSFKFEFEGYIFFVSYYEKDKFWWVQIRDTKLKPEFNPFFALRRHFRTVEELNQFILGLTGKIIQSV